MRKNLYACVTGSLGCTAETDRILYINYTSVLNNLFSGSSGKPTQECLLLGQNWAARPTLPARASGNHVLPISGLCGGGAARKRPSPVAAAHGTAGDRTAGDRTAGETQALNAPLRGKPPGSPPQRQTSHSGQGSVAAALRSAPTSAGGL